MEQTNCLYDKFPYETEFDGTILAVTPSPKHEGCYEVVLDQTLFSQSREDRHRIKVSWW